jgi:hypothetical protein
MQKQIDYFQKRADKHITNLKNTNTNKSDIYKTIQTDRDIIQKSGGIEGTLTDKKQDYGDIIPAESYLLKEGIDE